MRALLTGILLMIINSVSAEEADTIPLVRIDFTTRFTIDESGYNEIFNLPDRPDYTAFERGLVGMNFLQGEKKLKNDTILSLIDYSKPSNQRRLWVIDVKNQQVLHCALVAHGKNSGLVVPKNFSNTAHSNMSSQGFFVTGETYFGKHGYSLRLDGLEPGINDNARSRAIVMHSADYATIDFVRQYGRLGRSFGCPALPPAKSKNIIDTIKEGSCLYIYASDQEYATKSKIMRAKEKM